MTFAPYKLEKYQNFWYNGNISHRLLHQGLVLCNSGGE